MSGSPNVVLLSMTAPLPDSAATKIMTSAGKSFAEISIQADFDWQCLAHLEDVRKELFQRQFRSGQDEVEERGKFKKLRREVASILTLLRERQLGIHGQTPVGGQEN